MKKKNDYLTGENQQLNSQINLINTVSIEKLAGVQNDYNQLMTKNEETAQKLEATTAELAALREAYETLKTAPKKAYGPTRIENQFGKGTYEGEIANGKASGYGKIQYDRMLGQIYYQYEGSFLND